MRGTGGDRPRARLVLEATAEASDDAGELPDGDTDAEQDGSA